MSEETEMDLSDAISDDMASIAQVMLDYTPMELAKAARDASGNKVRSIRDQVLAGRAITAKQLWVLAEYYLYSTESDADEAMEDYGQTAWGDYDLG